MKAKPNILTRISILLVAVLATYAILAAIVLINNGTKSGNIFKETVIIENADSITYTAIIELPLRTYLPGASSDSIMQGFTDDRLATFYDGKQLYITALKDVPLRDPSFDTLRILSSVTLTLSWTATGLLLLLLFINLRRESKTGVLRRRTESYAWSIAILCPVTWIIRQADFLINAQSLKPILHGRYYGEISIQGDGILLLCTVFIFAALFSYSRHLSEEQQYTI